jgi:hypothetical protein
VGRRCGRRPVEQDWSGLRGSNPVQCSSAVRGRSGGPPATCDLLWPGMTARARRGPAVPGAVRTQRGPSFLTEWQVADRKSRRRSLGTRDTACPDSPAQTASDAGAACSESGGAWLGAWTWPAPSGGAILSARQCASSEEVSPGQARRGARSAPSQSRGGGPAANNLVVVSELPGVELPGRPPCDLRIDCPLVTVVVRSVQPFCGPSAAHARSGPVRSRPSLDAVDHRSGGVEQVDSQAAELGGRIRRVGCGSCPLLLD